jgi:hypothetical protein
MKVPQMPRIWICIVEFEEILNGLKTERRVLRSAARNSGKSNYAILPDARRSGPRMIMDWPNGMLSRGELYTRRCARTTAGRGAAKSQRAAAGRFESVCSRFPCLQKYSSFVFRIPHTTIRDPI